MLDRTLINLNNGNSCPSPTVVHDALKRYLDFSNQLPVYYRGQLEQNKETGAAAARRRARLRQGRARDHAQLQRGAADRAERHRPQARRRSPHDRAGLRPDADDLGSARAARRHQGRADQLPGADHAGRSLSAVREGDHAAHEGAALLPHHQPHRTGLPGEAAVADGAPARHPDDRRRRARVRALPVQDGRPRVRLLRHEPAQVAAGAAQHGLSLRPPRSHRPDLAADRRAGAAQHRHPQVRRGRDDLPPRRLPRSTRRWRSIRRSASSGVPRACTI